METDEIQKK